MKTMLFLLLIGLGPSKELWGQASKTVHKGIPEEQPIGLTREFPQLSSTDLRPPIASDNTLVELRSTQPGYGQLFILDLGDKIMYQEEIVLKQGINHIRLSLYSLEPGWYWVKISVLPKQDFYFEPLLIER